MPIPPSQGCIVFQTPSEPCRIFWPKPSSIKNRGIPSSISIMKNGIRKAPKTKGKKIKIKMKLSIKQFRSFNKLQILFLKR